MSTNIYDDWLIHYLSQKFSIWIPPPPFEQADPRRLEDSLNDDRYTQGVKDAIARNRHRWREFPRFQSVLDATSEERILRGLMELRAHLLEHNQFWIPFRSVWYPPLLRECKDPPAGLFAMGNRTSLTRPGIAVVGSRKATGCSLFWSKKVGFALASTKIAVISGGAYGCDIHAHLGSLEAQRQGMAMVVFAGGLSHQYPVRHRPVFRRLMLSGGVLVSERFPWTVSRKWDFPIRNRLIAGISAGVVVAQAAISSGTLITARLALDYGREVWVRPPPRRADIRFGGNQKLLEDGAPTWTNVAIDSPYLGSSV